MSVAPAHITRRDHLVGAALCAGYIALLVATAGDLGMSRDESMYVHAADQYARWLTLLWDDPSAAVQQGNIDRYWKANREHPPLAKLLFSAGHLYHAHVSPFDMPSVAYRAGGMLCAGLLLWLIYVFGAQLYGRQAGLMAALLYALLPRPFYHAHLTCFDVPITLAIVFCVYTYYRSLRERRWLAMLGLAFGLALATKHNSWVLPGIFLIHFLWVHVVQRLAGPGPNFRIASNPRFLWVMLLAGPPMLLLLWPWVWNDTAARLGWYIAFHMKHDYYNIAYLGQNHFWPPFPISFPWVMTWMTLPLTTLALAVVGVAIEGRGMLAALRGRMPSADPRQPAVLVLGCLLAPLVMISLPSTPIFGGTKHWMTGYPFLCLFGGLAFSSALGWARPRLPAVLAALRAPVLPAVAGALLLLPAALETAHSHPFGLSHYGVGAGGVPGSADLGMNRQFWGFTTRSVTDYLTEHAPRGARIYICDTTGGAFRMLQRDGWLPDHLRPTGQVGRADFALVHHEHHFAEVDHQIWSAYGSVRPVHVLTYDGVPIVSVYRNPRGRR